MNKLDKNDYEKVRPLFRTMNHHMATAAIINGDFPDAPVYVDDLDNPQTALMWTGHRVFLAGNTQNDGFNKDLCDLFSDVYYPQSLAAGMDSFILYHAPDEWQQKRDVILQNKNPITDRRVSLTLKALNTEIESALPDGYMLREVNQALIDDESLGKRDKLLEEMESERPSVQAFLDKSFGYILVHDGELAGWCLSEYNGPEQCEIGIAVFDMHQRQGLATKMAAAFIKMAQSKGIKRIGWHAWESNIASCELAKKLGFEQQVEYSILFAYFDEMFNLAVNGHFCFMREQYQEAIEWFEQTFSIRDGEAWMYYKAARAAAVLGKNSDCFGYLNMAIDKGWQNGDFTATCENFQSLHSMEEWETVMKRLQEEIP